jgi:asparagine synthase (glutamine-hydrolysing)
MSGFFGILRSDGKEVSPQLLQRVAETLRFRGSDGENIWRQPGAGTCFSYLATGPATQSLQQPVTLGDNWVLGDVRLDVRGQLIEQLHLNGNRTSLDPTNEELLLKAWQTWGESSMERILGDFSFALWDHNRRSLCCARDFVGPRPFYYAHIRGVLCFSNTLSALRVVPEVSSDVDEIFIGEFLLRGYCSDLSRTAYADIRRLPAGHLLRYNEESISVRRFLTLPIEEPLHLSRPEEYREVYRAVLQGAVQDRLPLGASALYLSGGLDSGSICAIATQLASQRNERQKLKAFTVSWRPYFDDPEPKFAALSAAHLGLAHHILEEQNFEPFAMPLASVDRTPELSSDATFALAQKYYRTIATHSRVVLSGDGGDDLLMGQSWPYFVHLWASGKQLEIARSLGSFFWTHGSLPPLRAGIKARLRRLVGRAGDWKGYPGWLNPEFEKRCGLRERWSTKPSVPLDRHPLHPDAYNALHSGYWSTIHESEDAGNTRVALESRAPLLDLRVLRFLLRVPPVPWCANKELVRHSLQGYLPEVVLNRPKTPLAGEPVEACIATGRWIPEVSELPFAAAERYVDWEKWNSILKYSKDCTSGANLFPFALVAWLKDVENRVGIQ